LGLAQLNALTGQNFDVGTGRQFLAKHLDAHGKSAIQTFAGRLG
jgi:hypothetical protein